MRIPARFNGPPGSGNGGWSAGAFATEVGESSLQVTLRLPPPLDTELSVTHEDVRDGSGTLVAELAPTDRAEFSEFPAFVPFDEAVEASRGYPGFAEHPFPTCYVCGPEHPDGLRIFPGPLGDGRMAAPWTVPADVELATIWAALDCPGGWSAMAGGRTYVLGRIAVTVDELPKPGARCVVAGRPTASSGRKAMVDSILYDETGVPFAAARATWIAVA
ncbi:hypothetical protein ACQPZX_44560 [Actinoplanes sp. CA-142083]|uniref:hypothetical protein n=1 Tax=Actinoplanes sp. CA-142083 TaxID=3239903 RepID=UPI003D8A2915